MRNEVHIKHLDMGYVKMHGFHGNRLYDFREEGGDRPINSIISMVLLIPKHYNWCQIKA